MKNPLHLINSADLVIRLLVLLCAATALVVLLLGCRTAPLPAARDLNPPGGEHSPLTIERRDNVLHIYRTNPPKP
jgi:hypothetical protein